MSENVKTTKTRNESSEPQNDGSANPELQEAFDEANEKGYFGEVQDDEDHTFAAEAKKLKGKGK